MLVKFVDTSDSVGRLDGFTVGEVYDLPEHVALRWIVRHKAVAVEESPAQETEHPPEPAEAATEVETPEAADAAPPADEPEESAEPAAEGDKPAKPRRGTRKKKS